jgi:ACS family tartrate transporter-like MFS transporter
MGSLAGLLMGLQGRLGLTGWQWLFLVEGMPAILLGAVFYFLLPDGPADAKWLTEAEREAVLAAVARDAAAGRGSHGAGGRESIGPAFRDARVWLIGAFFLCIQAGGYAYSFSAPAIVQRITGANVSRVGFLLAGLGLMGAAAMLLAGRYSDRSGERYMHVLPWCVAMLGGFVGCGLSSSPLIALPALALVFCAYNAMQGPLWAIPAAFLRGRPAAAGIAAINMIGILGGFIGPYWMGIAKDLTGDYQRGLLTMTVPMLAAAGIMLHLRRMARSDAAAEGALETPKL